MQGKGEWSGAKASEAWARQGGGAEEQGKGDQQKFPLSSSSPKLLHFFPRAIAPFTGIVG